MGKVQRVALKAGGQYNVGDPAATPDGFSLAVNNHLTRPHRLPARPPFVYDSLMAVNGLANFTDNTNKVQRLLAIDTSKRLYEKGTSGETWSSSIGTVSGSQGRLSDSANYLGKAWGMIDDNAGIPAAAFSFDGTNISTTPFNSALQSRTVTAFNERLFLAYPRVTVTPQTPTITNNYDYTTSRWAKTNVTVKSLTFGTNTVCRLYPTSTTNSYLNYGYTSGGIRKGFADVNTTVDSSLLWRQDLRCLDPIYEMPVTINALLITAWQANNPYALGDVANGGNDVGGTIQRCTTAGTSGGVAPTWATTVGATTNDGTAVWTCEAASNVVGSAKKRLPNATDTPDWTTVFVPINLPPSNNTSNGIQTIGIQLCLFSTDVPTIQLAPVDVSFRDGLTAGDPLKDNKGSQLTLGDYYYPFCNIESGSSATIDRNAIIWSEIRDPMAIRASNTYEPNELVGYPTAATQSDQRYIVWYRNGFIQFQGTADPDIPIRRESVNVNVGCLGPRAHDTFKRVIYFIAEDDIYAYTVGGEPLSITGEGMRETIMARGSSWVESQSTYNRPLLHIDKSALILWAYTQKGKLFAYDLRTKEWSTHYVVGPAGVNPEIDAMLWNQNTGHMYVSFGGYGLTYMDYAISANDTIDNTANTYPLDMSIVFAPIEASDGLRYDSTFNGFYAYYRSDIAQSGQAATLSISSDQGATYPHTDAATPVTVSTNGNYSLLPMQGLLYTSPSITLKLARAGKGGETSWSLARRAAATLLMRRGEYPTVNPSGEVIT